MNCLIVTGCILSTLTAAVLAADPDLVLLAFLVGVLAALQVVGAIAIACDQTRLGARLMLIGSVPLIPLGLVSAFGAVRALDAATVAAMLTRFKRVGA